MEHFSIVIKMSKLNVKNNEDGVHMTLILNSICMFPKI